MNNISTLLETMRPKQWIKNVIIASALVFDEKLLKWHYTWKVLAGCVLFSLLSGAIYTLNDLVDIDKDQQHPIKRTRPLPSGRLSPKFAWGAVWGITGISLILALWLSWGFALTLLGYLLLQLAYSFFIKDIVLLDVLAIAAGFVLRVASGVILVDAERFSPWLYICTTLGALFLALGKRRGEMILLGEEAENHRNSLKEYNLTLLDQLLNIVTASTILAYAFYTFSAPNLPSNHLMMLTIPFVIYGLFRYLYLIHVQGITLAPDEILLADHPIQITLVTWGMLAAGILYLG